MDAAHETERGQDLVEMLARNQFGGGKLLLPEEGVTRDNLHKWEPQNRDRSADCQNMSADKVGDCKVLAGESHNEST